MGCEQSKSPWLLFRRLLPRVHYLWNYNYIHHRRIVYFVSLHPKHLISNFIKLNHARDAFRKYATEIFILQMMTKNLLFFMFSKFINAWELTAGAGHIFEVFGIITMVLLATSIPMCESFTPSSWMSTDLLTDFP